ncbi:MAG: histidine phosphatase family protein [Rhodospirillales bacterium]|nr:histidine phosphatase family protein [Rhodospirillales bacterium]
MKTLLLLRHAKSAWSDPRLDDHDRPLNGRGERAAKAMADRIARQGPRPDLILCSTAMRTRQTLAPLLKRLDGPAPPISLENGLYLASEDALLVRLRAVADDVPTVLLIGHNDGIGQLAADLASDGPADALAALRAKYPTGALAVLRTPDGPWSELKPGSAKLLEFVRPRDLTVT